MCICSIFITKNGAWNDQDVYSQAKKELLNSNTNFNVTAYKLDMNGDGIDELIATYRNEDKINLRIYYMKGNQLEILADKSAAYNGGNENPTTCYMITEYDNNTYLLRERIVEEDKVRNTYYTFTGTELLQSKNIPEEGDYVNTLQQYPIVITTDPNHYSISDSIQQPPQI